MPATWLIRNITRLASLETGRLGQFDTLVTYSLTSGDGKDMVTQSYQVRLPKGEPAAAEIEQAVINDARLRAQVLGKKGTV